MMSLLRRRSGSIIVIVAFVLASVSTLILFRRSYDVFISQQDGIRLRRRDESNITFDLLWPFATEKSDVKGTLPATGSLLDGIKEVPSSIFGNNFDTTSNTPGATSRLPTVAGSNTLQLSTVLKEGSNAVDQATSVLGEIAAVATGLVRSILATETNPSNIGALGHNPGVATMLPQLPTPSNSEPQEFLPQISLTSMSGSTSSSAKPLEYSYSTVASSPAIPSMVLACPILASVIWTVTETWYLTHYEQTTTISSFASILNVTCTETFSICPSLTSYSGALANTPVSNQPSLISCAAGLYAKRAGDCPGNSGIVTSTASVLPSPSIRPISSANANSYGVIASAAAVLSVTSLASIIGTGISSPSDVIRDLSSIGSLTSLGSEVSVTTVGSELGIFACSDSIIVQASQNCLDGVLSVSADSNILNISPEHVNSALSGAGGPTDPLPKTISTPIIYLKDSATRPPFTTTIALPSLNGLVNVPTEQLSAALGGLKRRRDFKREESGDGVGRLQRTLEY